MKEKKYCIYIHTNKTNGKVYVGQTCLKPEQRWKKGMAYKSSLYFYNAIKKHGWDGFAHDILFTDLTLEDANKIEEKLINDYNSTNADYGYNIRSGGENQYFTEDMKKTLSKIAKHRVERDGLRKEVCQYSVEGLFIRSWECAKRAGEDLCIPESSIRQCCKGKIKTSGNYVWRYFSETKGENIHPVKKNSGGQNKQPVLQFDLLGHFIKEWESATQAFSELGINNSMIIRCCKGRLNTAGGYIWKYAKEGTNVN